MTRHKKPGRHPGRPGWASFWDHPMPDGIAGHGMATGCTVVTNNVREFARVQGFEVADRAG